MFGSMHRPSFKHASWQMGKEQAGPDHPTLQEHSLGATHWPLVVHGGSHTARVHEGPAQPAAQRQILGAVHQPPFAQNCAQIGAAEVWAVEFDTDSVVADEADVVADGADVVGEKGAVDERGAVTVAEETVSATWAELVESALVGITGSTELG